ncbi:hypothetical protein BGX29_007641 [Mortierella sp. GBA35]|nr:hypothetical protein BGX29_007641 [Mortierella sp. GBA35]
MNLFTLMRHILRCSDMIRARETQEKHLIKVLQNLSSDTDITYFEGKLLSGCHLLCRLYDTRCQILLDSVDLRDMIDKLSKIEPELAEGFNYTQGQKINRLME